MESHLKEAYCVLTMFSVDVDKSPQGHIDPDILDTLTVMNKVIETTSSCSGRITLMSGVKKGQSRWVYKNHEGADLDEIYNCIQEHGRLRFIYEGFIIHFRCKDQAEVNKYLSLLHSNGFKKSGMISPNLIIEVKDTGAMETIVTSECSKEYMSVLVDEALKRLHKTKVKLKKLESLF